MSDNNIIVKGMSNEQIMQAIGQDDGSSMGVNIPRLAINRSPEDDDPEVQPRRHPCHLRDSDAGVHGEEPSPDTR